MYVCKSTFQFPTPSAVLPPPRRIPPILAGSILCLFEEASRSARERKSFCVEEEDEEENGRTRAASDLVRCYHFILSANLWSLDFMSDKGTIFQKMISLDNGLLG